MKSVYQVVYEDGSQVIGIDEELVQLVNSLENPQFVKTITKIEANTIVTEEGQLARQVIVPGTLPKQDL